ncbi:RsmB/NOP family class I SAM-dependent RNA methyltransferase [Candidatus Pacearchaeota archaeon]|nr:RsmB/NOP family class I SAM-dependent RNA methyltransferase [Candidatus Pacearchaeota archaeon]
MAKPEMKPLFEERMKKLLSDANDFVRYKEIVHTKPLNYIRCNTLKISCDELFVRLNKRWKVVRPFKEHKEIMLVESELGPGQLGNAIEHLLGYYYIQEVCSMMSVIALDPKPGDRVLDVCASPGSKTTQMAARMENKGTLIANDVKLDRLRILAANLERCGVMNSVVVRNDGVGLCNRLARDGFKFDKILLDAPCSGEGTLRSSAKAFLMWNVKVVDKLSREQKKLIANAIKCLKVGGELVYSTCTHSPEENEEIVDFALKNFPVSVEKVHLPLKCRIGVTHWEGAEYSKEMEKTCRIYPQDNNSEGFFVSKIKLLEEVK